MLARRRLMALGMGAAEPRSLALRNLHTGERLEAIDWEAGRCVPAALAAVNRVLRDSAPATST